MAAIAHEKFRGISGDLTNHQVTYLVRDAADYIEALQAVDAIAPVVEDGLTKDNFRIEEVAGPGLWEITVSYTKRSRQPANTGEIEYAFDVALEGQKILQSYDTVAKYVETGTPKDYHGAINVDSNGEAQGVDVRVPISSFTISYYPAVAIVTNAYRKTIRDAVGTVNGTTFQSHPPGEVLFTGVSGRARNITDWELIYRFETRPNRTGLAIGSINIPSVDGWDLIWVKYAPDVSADTYIRKPIQVNIERVYNRIDFTSVLGIS